jgi:ABC-2 type transport system ATP-binding protein
MAVTADHLIVIGQGRLLAQTTVLELSARYASLEDAFFDLTIGAAEYSGSRYGSPGHDATYDPVAGYGAARDNERRAR